MKLNTSIELKSTHNEQTKENNLSIQFDLRHTPGEIFTTLKMAEKAMKDMIYKHIAENYENGKCTEEEFQKIYTTSIGILNSK